MSRAPFIFDGVGPEYDLESDPCDEFDRRAWRYHGIAEARAKLLDRCWCGNLKHSDMPLCNICKRVGETGNG